MSPARSSHQPGAPVAGRRPHRRLRSALRLTAVGVCLALAATEFAYDEQDHLHGDRLDAFLAGYSRTSRRPVATDTDTFLLWMTAVFCKFACYTLPLAEPPVDGPVQNPYLTRLRAVGAPRVREAVEHALTGAEAVHA